jgi:indole-3-glycerol phosphate synthase
VTTYLDRILERHREVAAADPRSVDREVERLAGIAPVRGFRRALRERDTLGVVSEIKRRSPSKGSLAPDLDPARLAATYERGGAACLSVLTDVEFFGGSEADLVAARAACSLPVLRKDFTVSALDVVDARRMGADCVLLIAAALEHRELVDLVALDAGATLVGVNQRDLVTFEVDHDRAIRMASAIPATAVRVAESGVRGPDDASALRAAGYDAVLVGETLVTSPDPAGAVAALVASTAPR